MERDFQSSPPGRRLPEQIKNDRDLVKKLSVFVAGGRIDAASSATQRRGARAARFKSHDVRLKLEELIPIAMIESRHQGRRQERSKDGRVDGEPAMQAEGRGRKNREECETEQGDIRGI